MIPADALERGRQTAEADRLPRGLPENAPMPWEAWFALALTAATLVVMARNLLPPDAALIVVAGAIAAGAVVSAHRNGGQPRLPTVDAVAAGFGSPTLWTVAALFVVAAGLVETGAAQRLAGPILGRGTDPAGAAPSARVPLARAVVPLLCIAPFLSNTTVMVVLLPVVADWCRRHRVAPSKLLMPLNTVKMLGAKCCLLGTTTNLAVVAMMEKSPHPGLHRLGLFEIAWVGLPCALAGVTYILLVGVDLLPDRRPAVSEGDDFRRYTVSVCVQGGGPLDGKSVGEAGLRHLPGLYLVEVERVGGEVIPAAGPAVVLHGGDRLAFAGALDSVVDLRGMRGLTTEDRQHEKVGTPGHERVLVEAVVAADCPLVGRTVREGRFRTHYGAAIIAIARGAERVAGKLGDVVLEPGDTLLLEARPAFLERVRGRRDFVLASKVEGFSPPQHERAVPALAVMAGLVLVTTVLHDVPFLLAALAAAGAMVATGCVSVAAARDAVEWRVVLAIGASFALGEALQTSGAARAVAVWLVDGAGGHPWVALACVLGMTTLIAEVVTNNAAAVLMYPLSVAAADRLGASPMPFVIMVMIGASCSFATPFSYQTNLMIMGPGGYRFTDYVRYGVPLTAVVGAVAVLVVPRVWPL